MIDQLNRKTLRLSFYGSWLILAILQAVFTQLQDDEAYYWVYAQFLDWGYFDHPPMIALLVKIGGFLFTGQLGVRILTVLMSVGTLWLVERLTDRKDLFTFYAICLSVAVLQLSGFWAVPDVPLMFFTAVFFVAYKRFLEYQNLRSAIWLALAVAALFYSKYHSVLVVGFAVLADWRVLKRPWIYLAGVLSLILFLPHLWWQYQHDWITFRFQLFENKAHPYEVNFTLDYLFGQLLIAGPIAGFILLYSTFVYRPKHQFDRVLKTTAVGIFIFFLLSTLRGQVEANWTSPAMVPMMVLTYQFLKEKLALRKWLYRLLPVSIILVLFGRAVMIFDILPAEAVVERFHAWKKWPNELKEKTGGLPVVFYNSYQRASMYWFHTGQMAYSLNTYSQRRSQYNYWPIEDSLLGKAVYRMDIWEVSKFNDSLQARMWKIGFSKDDNFHSFTKVQLLPVEKQYTVRERDLLQVRYKADIPDHYKKYLNEHPEVNEQVRLVVYRKQQVVAEYDLPLSLRDILTKDTGEIQLLQDLPKGDYGFIFSISSENEVFTFNSAKIPLHVTD